jgi:hypothetical protein
MITMSWGEAWDKDLLDIDPEALTVDWTVEYRATIHEVFAPGMHNRAYYHRYTDDNVDSVTCCRRSVTAPRQSWTNSVGSWANCHDIVCYGGAGLFDKHLASTIHCSGVSNAGAPAL